MIYKKTINIKRDTIDFINNACAKKLSENMMHDLGIKSYENFFTETACFENGYFADIKACTGDYDDPAWCEMVLFNENGIEVACTDVDETIDGDWLIMYNDDEYLVCVK